MDLDDYIESLPEGLREKARACTGFDDLVELAKQADAALPDEAIDAVAGGVEGVGDERAVHCPKCGNWKVTMISRDHGVGKTTFVCYACNTMFRA